jgi:signal transduction histidine kinase
MKSSRHREERLEAQVRELEERLRLSQKLGSIVHLASGMFEEFNNTLAMMMMCASLAKEGGDGVDQQELLRDLEKGCKRLTALGRQLLAFHGRSMINLQPLNLGEVVADQAWTLKPLLGERFEWQLLLPEHLPRVEADKALIEQVLLNLCLNARDAMQQGGKIQLELSQEEVKEERAKTNPGAQAGRFVRLSVHDTGCGMDERVLERLLGPFFTTNGGGRAPMHDRQLPSNVSKPPSAASKPSLRLRNDVHALSSKALA